MSYLAAPSAERRRLGALRRDVAPLHDAVALMQLARSDARSAAADRSHPHGEGRHAGPHRRGHLQPHRRPQCARARRSHLSRPRARRVFPAGEDAHLYRRRAAARRRDRSDRRHLAAHRARARRRARASAGAISTAWFRSVSSSIASPRSTTRNAYAGARGAGNRARGARGRHGRPPHRDQEPRTLSRNRPTRRRARSGGDVPDRRRRRPPRAARADGPRARARATARSFSAGAAISKRSTAPRTYSC